MPAGKEGMKMWMRTEEDRQAAAPRERPGARMLRHPALRCAVMICLCFLLTSTAWLAWEYHLLEQLAPRKSDAMTMVAGYLFQAAGMGLFALLLRRWPDKTEKAVPLAVLLHTLCLIPAILSGSLAAVLIFGFLMNLLCGYIAGYYLLLLTRAVDTNRRGTALGVGYSVSILASWALSRLDSGTIYYSDRVWVICLALTALILFLILWEQRQPLDERNTPPAPEAAVQPKLRALLLSLGGVVLLFSVVNNSGFAFSSADLVQGIRVEHSRLFYAVGLILAGLVTDRDRRYGAIAALSALVIPFVMLALRGQPLSLTVFWALNYFTYGFYSVYRMIVFSDQAWKCGLLPLACFGLMIGRVGDALGEAVCLALSENATALIFLTALLFVAAVFLFFHSYHPLYAPETVRQQSERERFYQFSVQHDLSSRERDMLRLLLEEKTNGEIAAALSISENTVKFHIRNLLQKTGCKNRQDLLATYTHYFSA